jgi:uncharacterized membrane protein
MARNAVSPGRTSKVGRSLVASLPAAFLVVYGAAGFVRFFTGHTGNYDLGIFTQGAQRWGEGQLPGSSIRGLDNLFADHFSPITIVFGVAWKIWPDPRSLILAQALALAGAVAVYAHGVLRTNASWRTLSGPVAVGLVVGAGLSRGMISAASFDVHEVAFGTLLVSGLCWGLLEDSPRVVLVCSLALLTVKEDLGLTVAMAGLVWWRLGGDRRITVTLGAAGGLGFVMANVVIVLSNPDHHNPYLQFLTGASGSAQGLAGVIPVGGNRLAPALLFLLAIGLIGLRSPIAWLGAPTLLWRAASSNESYWQTYFHYDAILVPIAAFALLDVLRRLNPGRWSLILAAGCVAAAAWFGVAKLFLAPVLAPSSYQFSATMQAARTLGATIPRGATVLAQQDLGPMLLSRADVRMLDTVRVARVKWVLLTREQTEFGSPQAAKQAWLDTMSRRGDVRITTLGAVTLVEFPAPEPVRLTLPD